MKARKDQWVLCILFCGFLAGMTVLYLFLPKEDFSETEKRYLAESPALNRESLSSGDFGTDAETYMADHIPFRNFFVGLNAYYDLLTGRQGSKDILVTDSGALVEAPTQWDEAAVQKNMDAINRFSQTVGVKVDLMLIPSAGWASQDRITGFSNEYRDEAIISDIYALAAEGLNCVDVTEHFRNPELYYRTDHHWTSQGAYTAYEAYMAALGRDCRPQTDFNVETVDGFRGSTYSRSALWLTAAEPLELWTGSENLTVTNGESDEIHQGPFYLDRLEAADKYTVFLDGNHSLVRIENSDALKKGSLLVIRDSYSNALGAFLAESYETVVLVDLRYYKHALSELMLEEDFDNVLVCYSIGNFLTDTNLIWLR